MNIQNGDMSYTMTLDNSQFEKSIKSSIGDIHLMESAVSSLVAGMAALASVEGIKAFASKAFEMRSFFQDAEAAMKVFLKSEDLAAEHLKELQSYAWYNVFEFTDLVTASRQLQAFGTEVEDVIPVIDKLSNIAAATNTPLENLVSIYNKAKIAGRLDSKGLFSLGNMGVNVKETLKEMGEQADVTSLSFEQLERVLDHLTSDGGMFAGLMDEQFNNLSSLEGAVEDAVDTLFSHFGEDLQPTFEKILKSEQELIAWIDENRDTLEKLSKAILVVVGSYGIYKGALALNIVYTKLAAKGAAVLNLSLGQVGSASKLAAARLGLVTMASKALNAALSASVWTALIAVVIKLTMELSKAVKMQHAVRDAASEAAREVIKEVEKERTEYNSLLDTLEFAEKGTDKYRRALEKLKKTYPEYLQGLIDEKGYLTDINAARAQGNKLIDIQIQKRATEAQAEAANQQRVEAYANTLTDITNQLGKAGLDATNAGRAARELMKLADEINYKGSSDIQGTIKLQDVYKKYGLNSSFSLSFLNVRKELADYVNINNQAKTLLDALGEVAESIEKENDYRNTGSTTFTSNPSRISENIEETQKEINELIRKSTKERYDLLDEEGNTIKDGEKVLVGLTTEEQERLKQLREDLKELNNQYESVTGQKYTPKITADIEKARIAQQEVIDKMADGYAKTVAEINNKYESEIKQLEYEVNNVLAPGTTEHELASQNLELKKKQRRKELGDAFKSYQAEKADASRVLDQLKTNEEREIEDRQYDLQSLTISLYEEGSQKEIAQMKLAHERRMTEIDREKADAIVKLTQKDKEEWEARQRAKGIDPNEGDFWSQYKGPSQDVIKSINDYYSSIAESQDAIYVKQQNDFLDKMLRDYGDYIAQKKSMDNAYWQDYNTFAIAYMKATTDEERDMYSNAMKNLKIDKAKQTLDLDLEEIDTTTYFTVAERIDDINKAYETYIESLRLAGASEAEINAAIAEQVEQTGTLTRLEAERADLEARIRNLQQGGTDKEGLSLADLLSRLAKVNKELESATQKSFKELWDENKNQVVANSIDQVTEALTRLAEATGSLNAEQAARFMSSLSKGLKGLQQSGPIGVLVAGIEDTLSQIVEAIVAGEALESSLRQAKVDKWREDMAAMMNQGNGGIFGNDTIDNLNGVVAVLEESRKKMAAFGKEQQIFDATDFNRILEASNLLSWRNWAEAFGAETRNSVKAYFDAIDKGYSNVEAHILRTRDRGWLFNFFGVDDKYGNLKDMVEGLGYELYDQYGNLNAEALQGILNTYEELSDADRKWLEEGIAYSEQYQEAMEQVAEYLQNLFGGVADTIADQMIDSFFKQGEAAIELGDIVSDVGKRMAKDLLKSMILEQYFNGLEDDFIAKIKEEGGMTAEASAYIIGAMNDAVARLDGDMGYWNQVITGLSTMWGDAEAASIGFGTSLSSASQESIDLLNGQLNAMRAYQGRMENMMNSVLLQLSGIHNDMNTHFEESNRHLAAINSNTSEGGLVRSLGAYFG